MSKQWGHGFYEGLETGSYEEREKEYQLDMMEINWIIRNLSAFFVDVESVDPVAISRAITLLLYFRNKKQKPIKGV